jgi:acetate kinase
MSADGSPARLDSAAANIPVAISARHVHLTQQTVERLFGAGYRLRPHKSLFQPGQYAAEETVSLLGPAGRLDHVRIVGPPRHDNQVEISRSDEITLGLDAPLRESGDLSGTPGLTLAGPMGKVQIGTGVVCALRHIHMSVADAAVLGLKDQDRVAVAVDGSGRRLVFGDVVVRVAPNYRMELHLDTDEGNAAGLSAGMRAALLAPSAALASVLKPCAAVD